MSALLVMGTLPMGLEVDGVWHADFVLGPLLVGDAFTIEAEVQSDRPDGVEEDTFRGLCRLARSVRSIGTLSRPLTGRRILEELTEPDLAVLMEAGREVQRKADAFRGGPWTTPAGGGAGGEGDRLAGGGAAGDA